MASRLPLLLAELRRRKVYHVAVAYVLVGTAVIGTADAALPERIWEDLLQVPMVVLIGLGLPISLVLAWAYELRPDDPSDAIPAGPRQPPDGRQSIIVLPFENMSPDPGDAYFSDGLTEEIITDLSYIHPLRVISRTSAMTLKGTKKDVRTIGKELDVQYVLEGSVRKAGEKLRITAQLVETSSDNHLWAERFDGELDDVFSIQETVARSIAQTLRVKLGAEEREKLAGRPIGDLRAYELYLKARAGILSMDREEIENAERLLGEALKLTGENAKVFVQLAYLHYQYWNLGLRLREEDLHLARDYADKALALDPESPDHLVIRGLLEVTGGSAVRGWRMMEAALDRDPDHHDALFWSPATSGFLGRYADAKTRWEQLRRVDPLNPMIRILPVWFEIKAGRFVSARAMAVRAREEIKGDLLLECAYAISLFEAGSLREATRVFHEVLGTRQDLFARANRALASSLEGDSEGVLAQMDGDFERWAEKDFQYSEWAAKALAQVGEVDRALDWLENSLERGNVNYPYLSNHDSFLANLRGHPRFEELMERVKLEWESLDV